MAERFLESKTKEVFVGKNAYTKVGTILQKTLPNQTVFLVTDKRFLNSNLEYYNTLLKTIKQPIKEHSLSKNTTQKIQIKNLIKQISEEVGALVFIGHSAFFDAVKIACSIKSISLILMPTQPLNFSYLLSRAESEIQQKFNICNTVAPMAVFVDTFFLNRLKKSYIISLFSSIACLQFFILDCTLTNFVRGKTIKNQKLEKLQNLVNKTLEFNEDLYNFDKKIIIDFLDITVIF